MKSVIIYDKNKERTIISMDSGRITVEDGVMHIRLFDENFAPMDDEEILSYLDVARTSPCTSNMVRDTETMMEVASKYRGRPAISHMDFYRHVPRRGDDVIPTPMVVAAYTALFNLDLVKFKEPHLGRAFGMAREYVNCSCTFVLSTSHHGWYCLSCGDDHTPF